MSFQIFKMLKQMLMLGTTLLLLVSCEKEATEEPPIDLCNRTGLPGDLLDATYTVSLTPDQLQAIMLQNGMSVPFGLELDYAVDIYTVNYQTLNKDHDLETVSGVMLIPQGIDTQDLVSVQHGTMIKRDEAGSINLLPGAVDGLLVAMNGYMVIEPDYLGLGISQSLHPYLNASLSANAVIDMIRAARVYACQNELVLSDNLFLAGYSEGGYVTLASQKIIEASYADEIQLTAVAPMAGPHDLLGSTRNLLQRQSYDNPAYLIYLVGSYDNIYGWDRLGDIFVEPYASAVPDLLDGSLGSLEINAQLPTNLDSLFNPEFRSSFLAGQETQFEAALIENASLNWGPIAPVRLIHGTSDSTVYYENSEVVYESMVANGGGSVDLIPLAGADHLTAAIPAYFFAIQWFDSLRAAN